MIVRVISSVLLALVLGIGSAWLLTSGMFVQYPMKNGPWRTSSNIGNKGDDMYLRAYSARIAWFSNDPDKSIYWVAEEDSTGRPLEANCSYAIAGGTIAARWWSVTAYMNQHWIANAQDRYSYANTNIATADDGSWVIHAGRAPGAKNWLPLGSGGGQVSFVLRLYDPDDALLARLESMSVPTIVRGACS